MQIEVTFKSLDSSVSVITDEKMTISEVLAELAGAGLVHRDLAEAAYLRMKTEGRTVCVCNTFRQEHIYDGEELRSAEE